MGTNQAKKKTSAAVRTFMDAVRRGDRDGVRASLAADPTLVSAYDHDHFGATALIHAANRRHREIVDILLEHDADIDGRSDWWAGSFGVLPNDDRAMADHLISRGATVDVHTAAHMGSLDRLREMLDESPELVHARGGDGQFPLHFAGSKEVVDLLLERGADLHARDIDHESTAAHWQASRNPEVARYLVEKGAETDPFLASATGDLDSLRRFLAEQPDLLQARITEERFPVSGKNPGVMHIYHFTLGHDATPLHVAAAYGPLPAVELLLEAGADPNAPGAYDDCAPLHLAAWEGRADVASALLARGADLNRKSGSQHRNEPIGWAIVAGQLEMVEFFLARGAVVNPYHLEDARGGASAEYDYTGAPIDSFEAILTRLENI